MHSSSFFAASFQTKEVGIVKKTGGGHKTTDSIENILS